MLVFVKNSCTPIGVSEIKFIVLSCLVSDSVLTGTPETIRDQFFHVLYVHQMALGVWSATVSFLTGTPGTIRDQVFHVLYVHQMALGVWSVTVSSLGHLKQYVTRSLFRNQFINPRDKFIRPRTVCPPATSSSIRDQVIIPRQS